MHKIGCAQKFVAHKKRFYCSKFASCSHRWYMIYNNLHHFWLITFFRPPGGSYEPFLQNIFQFFSNLRFRPLTFVTWPISFKRFSSSELSEKKFEKIQKFEKFKNSDKNLEDSNHYSLRMFRNIHENVIISSFCNF